MDPEDPKNKGLIEQIAKEVDALAQIIEEQRALLLDCKQAAIDDGFVFNEHKPHDIPIILRFLTWSELHLFLDCEEQRIKLLENGYTRWQRNRHLIDSSASLILWPISTGLLTGVEYGKTQT